MFGQAGDLAIHFVALILLTAIVESFEELFEKLFGIVFKKEIPEWVGYVIIASVSFFIVWVGDWRFMSFLGYNTVYAWAYWVDLILAAGVIAAGSNKLEKKLDVINRIPMLIAGLRALRKPGEKTDQTQQPYDPYLGNPYSYNPYPNDTYNSPDQYQDPYKPPDY